MQRAIAGEQPPKCEQKRKKKSKGYALQQSQWEPPKAACRCLTKRHVWQHNQDPLPSCTTALLSTNLAACCERPSHMQVTLKDEVASLEVKSAKDAS